MQETIDHFHRIYRGRLKPSTWGGCRSILNCHLARFKDLQDLNHNLEEYLAIYASGY